MIKLKKLLSDDFKIIRHRRLVLSIQITVTAWVVELITSFIAIFFTLIGIQEQNRVGKLVGREMINIVYTIVLPGIVIIRDSELKDTILQSTLYISILDKLGLKYKGPLMDGNSDAETPPVDAPAPTTRESNQPERNTTAQGKNTIAQERRTTSRRRKESNTSVSSTTGNNPEEKLVGFKRRKTMAILSLEKSQLPKNPLHNKDCEITDLE